MMQKNEEELLSKWIAYHSYLVGHENLFIFDNGSESSITKEQLSKAKAKGCNIIVKYTTKDDYENRGDIFCDFIKRLDQESNFDYYMLIDCDEFLATLDNEGVVSCDKSALQLELLKYENTQGTLLIDSQFYNSSVSPYWYNKQPYRKCFFRHGTIKSLDQGFHWGKVKESDAEKRTGLVHIHFHNKPYRIARLHAEEKLRGRVPDFSLETLASYRGKGFHLVRYFTEDEERFIANQICLNHIYSASLITKLKELGQGWPYAEDVSATASNLGFSDAGDGFKKQLKTFNGSIDNIKTEQDQLIISGWGIIRHAKPVSNIYLMLDNKTRGRFEIVSRQVREDVNEMLNVRGEPLGFVARVQISNISSHDSEEVLGKLCTFVDFDGEFFEFDMRRHLQVFNYALVASK
ncbi:hypothetical protein BFC17_17625 [Alteromonas lipolytica]|uniref:Uncharacterized protein n=2 Tax=Alteromonas lipolytica TaxID=1856405 RepID=A0A1E8FFC0_9ALTE|nr:hypothetical protein BFC17_17625 [Alteromonas lipolytica]